MDFLLGLCFLATSAFFIVFGIKLFLHDDNDFKHNHILSGGLANTIVGTVNEKKAYFSDEISRGFTIDVRSGEVVPCSQLSRDVIK